MVNPKKSEETAEWKTSHLYEKGRLHAVNTKCFSASAEPNIERSASVLVSPVWGGNSTLNSSAKVWKTPDNM